MKPPSKATVAKGAGFSAILVAMVAGATPIYQAWEGNELMPYKDVVGVLTVCSGDTRNVTPGKKLTQAECDARTDAILKEFGTAVAKSSPGIENSVWEWRAHTIHAANIGMGNYNKGSVRRLYNQGKHRQACRFMRKYTYAGGRVIQGLINRRNGTDSLIGEYEMCLAGAVPAELGR